MRLPRVRLSSAKNKRARKKTNEIEIVPSSTASPRRSAEARRAGGGTLEGARHAGQGAWVLQRPARRGGDAPRRDLGVAAFAGDATRLRATIWKYAEYFNVSVGAVRAVQQTDAITAEAKRLERLAAESEATTSDVSGTVSGAAGEEAARKPSASAEPGRRDAASASEDDEASLSRDVSSFEGRDDLNSATEARYSNRAYRKSRGRVVLARRRRRRRAAPARRRERKAFRFRKEEGAFEDGEDGSGGAVGGGERRLRRGGRRGGRRGQVRRGRRPGGGEGRPEGDRKRASRARSRVGGREAGREREFENSAHGSDGIQIFAADGDLRLAFRGDAEVASFAASDVSDVSDVEMKMDPSEPIEAFSETDVSAQTAGSYPPRLAAAEVAGTSSASSSAHAAAATGSSAPLTAADLGWNDLASSRLESNLDVQAATATARGGAVDLFLASPSQHYGWEALDVVLSLAARRDPPSVLSLSFGGRSGRAPAFRATSVPTTARRVRATKAPTKKRRRRAATRRESRRLATRQTRASLGQTRRRTRADPGWGRSRTVPWTPWTRNAARS